MRRLRGPAPRRRPRMEFRLTDIAALTALIEPEAQALGFALVRVKMTGG